MCYPVCLNNVIFKSKKYPNKDAITKFNELQKLYKNTE